MLEPYAKIILHCVKNIHINFQLIESIHIKIILQSVKVQIVWKQQSSWKVGFVCNARTIYLS